MDFFVCTNAEVYFRFVKEYLERIGVADRELLPDLATLRLLQRCHLLSVPFENLDIHWKRPIVLDTEKFYRKIVEQRRGGFCYELNGLFNELLRSVGFETRLISARVFNGKTHGPEFDHAAVIVTMGKDEYLADVGFGAFSAEPLRYVPGEKQSDDNGVFVIRKFDDSYLEVAKLEDGSWRSEYIFQDIARELSDFSEMCNFQQYSPDSHFRKGKLCSIMTRRGRKTLTENSFIVTSEAGKKETAISDESLFYKLLVSEFGIAPSSV